MTEQRGDEALGARVKAAIKRTGRKQVYVAERLGISGPAFSRLLKESRNLKLGQLQGIAAACGINLADLIGSPSATAPEAWRLFKELVLLDLPPFVAYDLATGRGSLLAPEERQRLNASAGALRAAFAAGQEPPGVAALFGEPGSPPR